MEATNETETTATATDLVVINKFSPLAIFSGGGADPLLEAIKKRVAEMPQDISTQAGRELIRSGAYEIARTKTTIDKLRVALVTDEKARLKKIDAEGGRIWDELEALRKDYRAPLTNWEKAEEERVAGHEAALTELSQQIALDGGTSPSEIERRIARAIEIGKSRNWEEFATRARNIHEEAYDILVKKLEASKRREAEAAELERLRQEEAARKQREHEERIAAEAAAKAKADAEEAARKAAEVEAARVKAEQERAEQERQRIQQAKEESDRQAVESEARAKKSEEDRVAAIAKAEADKKAAAEAAELARIAAAEQAKRDAEAAAKAERERIEAEQRKEQEAAAAREADKKHKGKINSEALAGLLAAGLSPESAKAAIEAIVKGQVPNVKINY